MIEDLLRAETLAARLEAACRAEPGLGRLWRAEGAVAEAVASVGLEGVRIDARDLLPRVALNGGLDLDDGGAEALEVERALTALRLLQRPGHPFRDPVGCVRRLERLAVASGPAGVPKERPDAGPEPRAPGRSDGDVEALLRRVGPSDPPILGALRVASAYRAAGATPEPLVERLLFVTVEGALREEAMAPEGRGTPPVPEPDGEGPLRGLGQGIGAPWIALPSVALTRGPFRLWTPLSARGIGEFLQSLVASLGSELGRLIPLRRWLDQAAQAGEGRTGRSRLTDAARLFAERPVMTARDLAEGLAITPRGATNLAATLADLGLLGEITHRRYARIWATPDLARLLEPRAVTARLRRLREPAPRGGSPPDPAAAPPREPPDPSRVERDWDERRARAEARLEKVFGELDGALARADALLGRR